MACMVEHPDALLIKTATIATRNRFFIGTLSDDQTQHVSCCQPYVFADDVQMFRPQIRGRAEASAFRPDHRITRGG